MGEICDIAQVLFLGNENMNLKNGETCSKTKFDAVMVLCIWLSHLPSLEVWLKG